MESSAYANETEKDIEVPPLERAGFGDRFLAYIVDSIIIYIILKPTQILIVKLFNSLKLPYYHNWSFAMDRVAPFVVLTLFIIITLAYFAVFAYKNGGQTLGKKWKRIKVVDTSGRDLTLSRFLLRELVARGLTVFAFLSHFGFSPTPWHLTYLLALDRDRRALHDYAAGTLVVKVGPAAGSQREEGRESVKN